MHSSHCLFCSGSTNLASALRVVNPVEAEREALGPQLCQNVEESERHVKGLMYKLVIPSLQAYVHCTFSHKVVLFQIFLTHEHVKKRCSSVSSPTLQRSQPMGIPVTYLPSLVLTGIFCCIRSHVINECPGVAGLGQTSFVQLVFLRCGLRYHSYSELTLSSLVGLLFQCYFFVSRLPHLNSSLTEHNLVQYYNPTSPHLTGISHGPSESRDYHSSWLFPILVLLFMLCSLLSF
ncbi:hypothetical protein Cgig2_027214 [Carnegiea gigantea]|uniref:Uncharacterized protein n=1 Tax=Carnegiea gigantea TaxID=171969 RepID=A0A9Q1GR24_9CARY|nr:hypothetical protein Cgig2_027214 [Carnegiea gigantea]